MKKLPKLIISDIDGVWTDGGMYLDNYNNEWKKFNTSDSAGVLFLNLLEIPLAIITGEDTEIVKRRIKKLGIKHLFMGVKDKVNIAKSLCDKLGISLEEVAFIGDDINDLLLLKEVGFSASPNNAPSYIKNQVDFVTEKRGGDGAFREFIEHLITKFSSIEMILSRYNENVRNFKQ